MRILIVILLFFGFSCKQASKSNSEKIQVEVDSTGLMVKVLKNKNSITEGRWINMKDSLSTVKIEGNQWIFQYGKDKTEPKDYHKYVITESVFDKDNAIVDGCLFLIQESDTLKYGIAYLSEKSMTLVYLPRGNFHHYKKME
ncbi:hypothetical protein [Urechidicola vernalis]|uniref:Lipoprotein n=1 Tax=Urechidicola vernalis TaxID=3075600 RepID=A0ABU2Y790_9FLAO|nr:hypothetical protein [Urechidicola sp. P050]MDT0553499.1 hypothetical protein [Urechidicola sp. P050]